MGLHCRKAQASIKSRSTQSGGGEGPGPVDKSSARHLLGLCEFGSDRPGLTTIRILAGVSYLAKV
jgi:hypothetical protein